MFAWLEQFLVRYPELALFLVIAGGYWIGGFRVGAFSLGPVTGSLFAGLLVGNFAHVPVSGMAGLTRSSAELLRKAARMSGSITWASAPSFKQSALIFLNPSWKKQTYLGLRRA